MMGALRRWTAVVVMATAVVLAGACSGGDSGQESEPSEPSRTAGAQTADQTSDVVTGSAGVSEAEAIEIARAWVVEDDAEFDFSTRFDIVRDQGDTYEVSFPRRAPNSVGGEPHVVVDKATGEIVDSWYTL